MKNDNKVKTLVTELRGLTEQWALAATPYQTCDSDRIIENIVTKSKELERMHEGRFDSVDLKDMIKI